MQFAGIFHKTSEQMSYALNENELIVNLRTGIGNPWRKREMDRKERGNLF